MEKFKQDNEIQYIFLEEKLKEVKLEEKQTHLAMMTKYLEKINSISLGLIKKSKINNNTHSQYDFQIKKFSLFLKYLSPIFNLWIGWVGIQIDHKDIQLKEQIIPKPFVDLES